MNGVHGAHGACRAAAVAAGFLTLAACGPTVGVRSGPLDSPTGGVAMLYDERSIPEQRFRRFELVPDGTLRFGGGAVARRGEFDWSGQLEPRQIEAILAGMRRAGLFEAGPECEQAAEGARFALEVAWPEGARRYDLTGPCPAIDDLRAALEEPTRSRFRRELDALPEAGQRPAQRR